MAELYALTAEPLGETIIEQLELALEEARAGKLSSIAIAKVNRDGCISGSWSYAPSVALLIAATADLQFRLLQELNE